jgi:hypothetical protein
MLKHHKLIALITGLLFLIVLQKFATPEPVFRFLIPAFIVYSAVLILYNQWYLKNIQKYNFWMLIRPFLLILSAFGLFLVIPSAALRSWFLITAVGLITIFEIVLGNFSENLLLNESLITAFGIFFTFFAAYYYFPTFEPVYLAGVFFCSALLARSFYEFMPQSDKIKTVGAIILGLFTSELYWVLNFLHFHYSALSLILFNFFYFFLILNYYHLFHVLNFKKVKFHLFFMAVCILLVLLSTPWKIIT